MQDYNYIFHGTMEITLEVSCCKHPKASLIQDHWQDNRKALIAYVFEALRGVKGFVSDAEDGRPLSDVQLYIKDRNRDFNTTKDGEYWRILLDGNYTLQVNPLKKKRKKKVLTITYILGRHLRRDMSHWRRRSRSGVMRRRS